MLNISAFGRRAAIALGAVLMVAAAGQGLKADGMEQKVVLTFSSPVQIPGRVLPAGTYVFRPLAVYSHTVVILNANESKAIATELTIPVTASHASAKGQVQFEEQAGTKIEAIRSWFVPSDTTGYEFLYGGEAAQHSAGTSAGF
jgi:hypothetical protein